MCCLTHIPQGFLRNWYRGRSPPQSGADDCQANCFTRVAPIVALFGGGEDASLLMRVGAWMLSEGCLGQSRQCSEVMNALERYTHACACSSLA